VGGVTRILSAIEERDPHGSEQILLLVYAELRRLAGQRWLRRRPIGVTSASTGVPVLEANSSENPESVD
jgi:hypothetical protein